MELSQGDYLERTNSQYIKGYLPEYEKTWKKYIGHDGGGKMPELNHLSADQKKQRQHIAQSHYTCLESLICMKRISDEPRTTEYVDALNDFMSFHAHGGRIRDNIVNIYYELKLATKIKVTDGIYRTECSSEFVQRLQDIFEARNNVLHGCKLPIQFTSGFPIIAIPKTQGKPTGFAKNQSWEEIESTDFDFLSDYLKESYEEVLRGLRSCLDDISKRIVTLCETIGVDLSNANPSNPLKGSFTGSNLLSSSFAQTELSGSIIVSGSTEY